MTALSLGYKSPAQRGRARRPLMLCIQCGHRKSKVLGKYDAKPHTSKTTVYTTRYRKCLNCGWRFKSVEYYVLEEK